MDTDYKTCCKNKMHSKLDNICQQGCDYVEARTRSKREAERMLKVEIGQPFFVYGGLSLIPGDGGEVPVLTISMGKATLTLEAEQVTLIIHQLRKGLAWCKEGYCSGIC